MVFRVKWVQCGDNFEGKNLQSLGCIVLSLSPLLVFPPEHMSDKEQKAMRVTNNL